MNLTDLQIELREIEKRLALLHNEIDNMKPSAEKEVVADFMDIDRLAKKYSVTNEIVLTMVPEIREIFFRYLSFLVCISEENIYSKLIYLTRLSFGSGLEWKSEDIYKSGIDIDDIYDINELKDYRVIFLLEAFIVVNINGQADEKTLSVVADIAKIMNCKKEEIRIIAEVAKCILINNMESLSELPCYDDNIWQGVNQLRQYIPNEWIINNRVECGLLCTRKYEKSNVLGQTFNDKLLKTHSSLQSIFGDEITEERIIDEVTPCKIIEKCESGNLVKKGELICKYKKLSRVSNKETAEVYLPWMVNRNPLGQEETEEVEREIYAPKSGKVFYIEREKNGEVKDKQDAFILILVCSYFDDYNNLVEWINDKEQRGV